VNQSSLFFKLVMVVSLFSPAISVAGKLKVEEASQVQQVLADYRAAWLEGDKEKVLATLSDEILLFVPSSTAGRLDGKQAVKEFWFPPSDINYPIKAYEISDQEVFGSGEFATATGKSKLIWETVDNGTVTDSQTSNSDFMTVLRKEEGHWRIYRQMYQMRK
jgi:ketosteroid isomerase-like protein